MARRLATPILLAILPLTAFLTFFHAATLDIGNAGWLIRGTDNGENALGAHAYWHDRAAGFSLRTTLLNAPEGVPILYTDSDPLLAFAARPFAGVLPADAQLVGPSILLWLMLQSVFAWLLLRRHAPGPIALWAGVALLAFPPTLFNRFVHANLMAHWTILAALWLFLDPVRSGRLRWWAPLIAVTALIHSYLLVMVGAVWASAMLARLIRGSRRKRIGAAAQIAAILALVAALAWWLGVSDQVPAGNFGVFSMPLDALWNPGLGHFSTLLPAHEINDNHGFEGFQYLGAGGLMLVVLAILATCRYPAPASTRITARRLRWLLPALAVLTVLATLDIHLAAPLPAILDPVRASGRLFWPVGYVLILMAILGVYRLSADRAGLLLVGVIAVQIVDLAGMAHAIRAQSADAARHSLYARTRDLRWDRLIAASRSVAFVPADVTRDLALFQEVAWRSAGHRVPVGNVYAARTSRITAARLAAENQAFAAGALVPGRLYVLLPGTVVPAAAIPRTLTIDGVTVMQPVSR